MKNVIDLSGVWDLSLDPEKKGIDECLFSRTDFDDSITLPGTTALAHKGTYSTSRDSGNLTCIYPFEGYAWYSRKVTLPEDDAAGRRIILHLERTRLTHVWVDGVSAGTENSLTTPHIYDLTDLIHKNTFRLTIMVSNTDYPTKGGHLTSPDTQSNWNGIVGEISLHICDPVYISRTVTWPDPYSKTVKIDTYIVNTTDTVSEFRIMQRAWLREKDGRIGLPLHTTIEPHRALPHAVTVIHSVYSLGETARLWSEFEPYIYQLDSCIYGTGEKSTTYFGLRDFTTDEKRFRINGRETFLRGKHDGLIFPETGVFPTDLNSWLRTFETSKAYGINHYRYHTCCPPEAAFLAADLTGIYMEPQLPFWGTLSGPDDEYHNSHEHKYLIGEGYRMLDTYGNHPSFCMMSLGNELWGNKFVMNDILHSYRVHDTRHLYTEGSNNFQHAPLIMPEDDFYVGVRLDPFGRNFRGSYGMCDAPLGHVQTDEPSTLFDYDDIIRPKNSALSSEVQEEIEIQYGTGVKKVKASEGSDGPLIPHIPVVSHEIGQYCTYPDLHETEKYTGPLRARNYEIVRDALIDKGMLDEADDFFYASGKLAVDCYKEELESAARSEYISGYQILDIQDFNGQGTALVGILDSLMESKGLVTKKKWAGFCSPAILMAKFPSYVLKGGDDFMCSVWIRYYLPEKLVNASVHWKLVNLDITPGERINVSDDYSDPAVLDTLAEGRLTVPEGTYDLVNAGNIHFRLPDRGTPGSVRLILSIDNSGIENSYDLWIYPESAAEPDEYTELFNSRKRIESEIYSALPFGVQRAAKDDDSDESPENNNSSSEKDEIKESSASDGGSDSKENIALKEGSASENSDKRNNEPAFSETITAENGNTLLITNSFTSARDELNKGGNVLYFPYEITDAIRGFYCTDFWCYPMFRNISDWMKKPVAVGTMGLLIDNRHPVFKEFPTLRYSTPQWYKIVSHSDLAVLENVTDKNYRPVVSMIDNFDRNHKLGLLFEGKSLGGNLMICTARLSEINYAVEVKQFIKALMDYCLGDDFKPEQTLDFDRLKGIIR